MKAMRNLAILMIAMVVGGFALTGPAAASKTTIYQEQDIYVSQKIAGNADSASNIAVIDADQNANAKHGGDIIQIQNIGVNQEIKGPKEKPHKDDGKGKKKHKGPAPKDDASNVAIIDADQNANSQ